jgi:segregation and condensation protein B
MMNTEPVETGASPKDVSLSTPGGVPNDARRAIEAIVMVASDPVEPSVLAQLLEVPVATIESLCDELAEHYRETERGFELVKIAGGYRFQSHGDLAPYVERFVLEGQTARLSPAALETLAIVAYKQPVSRAQVASIRGVDPDGVLRTLQARGYVDIVGRDDGPGQAMLWGTTTVFLEKLGLDSLGQLPPLHDYVPGADVVEALEHGLRIVPVDIPEPRPSADARSVPIAVDDSFDLGSDDAVPDDAVPDDAVPDDAVPDDAVPDDAVPDDAAPDL